MSRPGTGSDVDISGCACTFLTIWHLHVQEDAQPHKFKTVHVDAVQTLQMKIKILNFNVPSSAIQYSSFEHF